MQLPDQRALREINQLIATFRAPLQQHDFFMSVSNDRNVGNFLKIHWISPSHTTPIEIWLHPVLATKKKKKVVVFISYRNFTMFRTFPTISLFRNGYPSYRDTNSQEVFRRTLSTLHSVGLHQYISDWDRLVEANEYRRQVPEFNQAALVLRERVYPA